MTKIVVANWKMNPHLQKDAETLFKNTIKEIKNAKNNKIIICPPFPFLFIAQKSKNKKIILGAQNCSKEIDGSHTGQVSVEMLKSMKVNYVIVGHSENRTLGEDNKIINKKILNLFKFKISPILCIGETYRDKDGVYLSFIEEQIKVCLSGVSFTQIKNIIIAYEPVWAIGVNATREATKEEFMEIKIFIKKVISDLYDAKIAHSIPILYGGSVNPDNAKSFVQEGRADGLLVGRDSINYKKFGAILSTLN
jgi:triosephosphate isomerase